MPGNSFGKLLRVTTFGESHGAAVGAVIDGVPAGLPLDSSDIQYELSFRRPGHHLVSPRREEDKVEILSGVFNGRTTGAPIAIIVRNTDVDSSYYEELKFTPRPGHADLPYIIRYGFENWDYRGGGRASGRETVARVAAGAIAKKLLAALDVWIAGCVRSIGDVEVADDVGFEDALHSRCSPVRSCSKKYEAAFISVIESAVREGDSYGAIVEVFVKNPPAGLGEPVFDKIKADLAKAIMSIPGAVGFEIGLGFRYARAKGSVVMDEIVIQNSRVGWRYNYSGGVLGGITTGEPIVMRCAFKPTSSIKKPQKTVDMRTLEERTIVVKGRHDPCIGVRAVAVVEAMTALVIADHAMRSGFLPLVKIPSDMVSTISSRWRWYRGVCMDMEESQ
ncbi:MAG: chorismate synthase [Ignisphaera sp.]|nr:chorismate synthase [Ignisphaera sp.]MCX8167571.1 chorismate synthase [Ignisphaera sp.]MDW8086174.1 chorismate synthase [Ignisphaera sp.]